MILAFVAAAAFAQTRVIISTDMSMGLVGGWRPTDDVDDGWAVGMALADRTLDVRLIATVLGNSNVGPEHAATLVLLDDVLYSHVDRARGAAVALDIVPTTLNGAELPKTCLNDATAAMEKVLSQGRATILAIGPLTDVACLARNAPVLAANIDRVVAIMGRAPGEAFTIGPNKAPVTDFNVTMDPTAVTFLLTKTEIPMTFLQFDLTKQVLIRRADVEKLKDGTPLQKYFYKSSIPFVDFWSSRLGEDGFHPWDSNAIYYAGHPSAFRCTLAGFALMPCASTVQPDPYNRFGQCAGHSVNQSATLDRESMQLWLDRDYATRKVTTCTGFSSPQAQQDFENAAVAFLTPRAAGGGGPRSSPAGTSAAPSPP